MNGGSASRHGDSLREAIDALARAEGMLADASRLIAVSRRWMADCCRPQPVVEASARATRDK